QVHQLPELCSIVFGSLCEWNIERQTQFSLYCYHLFSLVDTPAPVVYTSLKYVQTMLAKGTEMDEYSLFTVALVLSYKYTEDHAPPFMLQWSCASMIPVETLTILELDSLSLLDYSLYISADAFRQWTEECNVLYDL
ncbi:hypothetical protein K501DRAFT_165544, partial [Backusella circina FSU 941]